MRKASRTSIGPASCPASRMAMLQTGLNRGLATLQSHPTLPPKFRLRTRMLHRLAAFLRERQARTWRLRMAPASLEITISLRESLPSRTTRRALATCPEPIAWHRSQETSPSTWTSSRTRCWNPYPRTSVSPSSASILQKQCILCLSLLNVQLSKERPGQIHPCAGERGALDDGDSA